MNDLLTEIELIAQLKKGNEAAFKQLVALYQDRIFNTSLGLLQSQPDAEDATQDVFVIVYKSIAQFKGASKLSTWIYRITVTCCLDKIRSKKRKKRFAFLTELFNQDNLPVVEPENFVHPGVLLDRKEDARLLFRLIEQLPENQRMAFVLNKVEGLSYGEIALILRVSEKAVDSLLQRARIKLKGKLNKMGIN